MPELKFFDTAVSFNFDATGEVPATGQLCLVPQGVGASQRVGRRIDVVGVDLRGRLRFDPGASAAGDCVASLFVLQDTQTNGAAAGVTDVFTGSVLAEAMLNPFNELRFGVVHGQDFVFNAGAGVSGAYTPETKMVDWAFDVLVPLEFSSTTGAITELRSNNLCLFAGVSPPFADDLVTFEGRGRIWYYDV